MAISDPGRGLVRRLGVTAAALLAFAAASQQRAEALSLASPGTAPSAKFATDGLTTEVQHRGHGGGFRGGGMAIHRGGFRAAPVFRGGGMRYGYRHVYHRPHFYHRHHFHRRFYAPRYYGYPYSYGYRHRYCRVIWTYYGPRKICRYRPWWRHRYYGYRYW